MLGECHISFFILSSLYFYLTLSILGRYSDLGVSANLHISFYPPYFFSEPSNKYFDSWASLVGADGYTPIAGSPLLGAASFAGWTGFDTVTYIGAFDGSNNWMSGWTNFDPQNAKY